jgi:hypothetical protein
MFIEREVREELKALSTAIFGVSSRWQKILKGNTYLATREVEEEVPAEFKTVKNEDGTESQVEVKPAEKRKVQVPMLTEQGAQYKTMKYYTVQEVLELLREFKKNVDAFHEMTRLQEEEKKAQEAAKKALEHVTGEAQGSAV